MSRQKVKVLWFLSSSKEESNTHLARQYDYEKILLTTLLFPPKNHYILTENLTEKEAIFYMIFSTWQRRILVQQPAKNTCKMKRKTDHHFSHSGRDLIPVMGGHFLKKVQENEKIVLLLNSTKKKFKIFLLYISEVQSTRGGLNYCSYPDNMF